MSNAFVTNPAEIEQGIERAKFVKKEIETLYVGCSSSHVHFISYPTPLLHLPTNLTHLFAGGDELPTHFTNAYSNQSASEHLTLYHC